MTSAVSYVHSSTITARRTLIRYNKRFATYQVQEETTL